MMEEGLRLESKISDHLPSFAKLNIPEEDVTHEKLRIATLGQTRCSRNLREGLRDDCLHCLKIRHCFRDEFIDLEESLIGLDELCGTLVELVQSRKLSTEGLDTRAKTLDVIWMKLCIELREHGAQVDWHLHELCLDLDDLVADGDDLPHMSVQRDLDLRRGRFLLALVGKNCELISVARILSEDARKLLDCLLEESDPLGALIVKVKVEFDRGFGCAKLEAELPLGVHILRKLGDLSIDKNDS